MKQILERRAVLFCRFGTGTSVNGSDSSKKADELKRKARAERFGVVQTVSADEEAKKKARLARFGSISKPDSVETWIRDQRTKFLRVKWHLPWRTAVKWPWTNDRHEQQKKIKEELAQKG